MVTLSPRCPNAYRFHPAMYAPFRYLHVGLYLHIDSNGQLLVQYSADTVTVIIVINSPLSNKLGHVTSTTTDKNSQMTLNSPSTNICPFACKTRYMRISGYSFSLQYNIVWSYYVSPAVLFDRQYRRLSSVPSNAYQRFSPRPNS